MLRPSPNHGTQRLPNDDDDDAYAPGVEDHGIIVRFTEKGRNGDISCNFEKYAFRGQR